MSAGAEYRNPKYTQGTNIRKEKNASNLTRALITDRQGVGGYGGNNLFLKGEKSPNFI
jgi:hypothetical protein